MSTGVKPFNLQLVLSMRSLHKDVLTPDDNNNNNNNIFCLALCKHSLFPSFTDNIKSVMSSKSFEI